jgi:integrase
MAKRGNNEGTISKRSDGRWQARLTQENGRRKYFYARTRQEVARLLTTGLRDRDRGLPVVGEKQTVGEYLTHWLATSKHRVKPRTHQRYGELLRVHAVPALGKVPLARLTPQQVQALYTTKLNEGLSQTTVRHLHAVLRTAISHAERQGLVPRNVVALTNPPRMRRPEMRTLTAEQAQTLLAAAQGNRLAALYVLALTTGMRQGELLALRWRDVDLDSATLRVTATLQTTQKGLMFAKPRRTVAGVKSRSHPWLWPHSPRTAPGKPKNGCAPVEPGRRWTWSLRTRSAVPCKRRTCSPEATSRSCGAPDCRAFASMTCATRPPRCSWRAVSRSRWSANCSDTPA